jgi:hypothetical protein
MLRHEGRKSLPRCCMGVDVVAQRQFAGKKRHAEMLRHASIQRVGSEGAVANQVIADADALPLRRPRRRQCGAVKCREPREWRGPATIRHERLL